MVLMRRRGNPPVDRPLPDDLRRDLREWRDQAATAVSSGRPAERELVRVRGRRLAGRVAEVIGRPVEFGEPNAVQISAPNLPPEGADEPVPWATGLPISAFAATVVALGDVSLSQAFADAFGLLWVPANLLVVLGLTPSLFLLRRVEFWRWPAYGTAAGLLLAWVVLLLGLLTPG